MKLLLHIASLQTSYKLMKQNINRKFYFLLAASAVAGLAPSALAGSGSFLTLTNLTASDVDVVSQADATPGANGVSFIDTDGAGALDDGVYKITTDTTWSAGSNYILTRKIFVDAGATLTIEPGTVIYNTVSDVGTAAKADDEFGSIIVTRGGKIVADGSSSAPISFTSIGELEASRGTDIDGDGVVSPTLTRFDRGLWGGLVILGNANVYNYSAPGTRLGENEIEGFAPAFSPDADSDSLTDLIEYGGNDDADDSGTLRYVSIRHGGYEFAAGDEINGLTLGGVGNGTTLEYIEVLSNSDDGIEFFGGSVDIRYALVAFCKDDAFDIDEGYSGRMQFIANLQNATGTNSAGESVQDSDHGGEWDGNGGGDSSDVQSSPTIANLTFIGDNEGDHAFKFDDFFAGNIYNSAATNYVDLITVTGDNSAAATGSFTNVTTDVANSSDDNLVVEGLLAGQFTSVTDVKLKRIDVVSGLFDPRPASDSPLLTGNGAAVTDMTAIDTWFAAADYQGAFSEEENWALGWTGVDAFRIFDLPVDEFAIVSTTLEGDTMTIVFGAVAGNSYKVTESADLAATFVDIAGGDVTAAGSTASISFIVPSGATKYFFRIEAN